MSIEKISFGKFVKEMRQLRSLERGQPITQAELCRELGVGDDPPSVASRIEADKQYLSKEAYERLGVILGFTLDENGPYSEDRVGVANLKMTQRRINSRANQNSFGVFIAQLRLDRGYRTRKAFADATGLTRPCISEVERDLNPTVDKETMAKLMDILDFTPANKWVFITRAGRKANRNFETPLGKRLKELREARDLTQSELGRILGYHGKNPANMISLMERGVSNPTKKMRKRLTEIFGI